MQVNLPQGLKSIGSRAFYNCLGLKDIYLPDTLVNLEKDAFFQCRSIQNVYIPEKINRAVLKGVFDNPNIRFKNYQVNEDNYHGILQDNSIQDDSQGLNTENSSLKDFVIEDSVLKEYTGNEKKVVIPKGIIEIGYYAFADNENIVDVVLPSDVRAIRCCAFSNCINLQSVQISGKVWEIEDYAFENCSGKIAESISVKAEHIGRKAFVRKQ